MTAELPPPRHYCSDCPTPAGDCQCNWAKLARDKQIAELEKLAKKNPSHPYEISGWIDRVLGQGYAHLKSLQKDNFDGECIAHLSDAIHHLGELKERYNELVPF
jgi:hypothetical protein